MSDTDLVKLYSGQILALAADIPHLGHLPQPQGSSRKRSPLCGSTVTVEVMVKDGRVTSFAQDVKACALGQASAAILGQSVIVENKVGAGGTICPGAALSGLPSSNSGPRLQEPPRLDSVGT